MAVTVRIPTQLRELSGGCLRGSAPTARPSRTCSTSSRSTYPGFAERLFDEKGELRRFVNVFVADEDIRFLSGVDTAIEPGRP